MDKFRPGKGANQIETGPEIQGTFRNEEEMWSYSLSLIVAWEHGQIKVIIDTGNHCDGSWIYLISK